MYQSQKSASTAGLLGIFLGSVGAHNWYLGDKKKGIIHVSMIGLGILLEIIAFLVTPKDAVSLYTTALSGGGNLAIVGILSAAGGLVFAANGIWGAVEGIIILSQGDAGLAAKGYAVAGAVPPASGYGSNQSVNGFNQAPQQNYSNQPMPGQGYFGQPIPPSQPMNNAPDMSQNAPQPQGDSNMGGDNNGQQ